MPANARVIYLGDYNVDNSGEPMYQTLLAVSAPNGITQGQRIDPLNPTDNPSINWSAAPVAGFPPLSLNTEKSYDLLYRDDLQVMTTNVYYGLAGGLKYVAGTYHTFGNNGSTAYGGSVNNGTDTALNNNLATNAPVFITASQLCLDITNASDHLPVVADYTIPLPVPMVNNFILACNKLVFNVGNSVTGGVSTVLTSTNLLMPLTNWTMLATNTATSNNFTLTLTNGLFQGQREQFYRLLEK